MLISLIGDLETPKYSRSNGCSVLFHQVWPESVVHLHWELPKITMTTDSLPRRSFLGLEGQHVFITGAAGAIGGEAVREFLGRCFDP